MNADQSPPSSSHQPSAAVASANSLLSRASPFPPATTPAATAAAAASGDAAVANFLPSSHLFRALPPAQSPYSLSMPTATYFDRDPSRAVGGPVSSKSPSPAVGVLIRRLPLNTSEESLRLMVVWSKDLADVELLPVDKSQDDGFRSALLRFRSMAGALEAKNMLDGRANISNDAEMIVEILTPSPGSAWRHAPEPASGATSSATASAPGTSAPGPGPRLPSRFNGTIFPSSSIDSISPTSTGAFPSRDLASYHSIFSPQSPIGSHLSERPRISGKTLINNDFGDDDETSDLLKDPVAYAENGAISHRRATAPHLPIGRMASLSLNTGPATGAGASNPPGPSSLPPYMMAPLSPLGGGASPAVPAGLGFPVGGAHGYHQPPRHNFPPVNPADQNPPCNTLYVGNLPLDTSEEELKAMFSKQRGYKRLCFRTKQNGPMCFVEFEDISFATKALHELYGHPLHNSVKGGIRLSFSKNPLGVRSGQAPGQGSSGSAGSVMAGNASGFTTAHGPPPGLAAPPGLGSSRGGGYNVAASMNTGGNHPQYVGSVSGLPGGPWNTPYNNGVAAGPNAYLDANPTYLPRHMMGR